jgi:hypothetical protein
MATCPHRIEQILLEKIKIYPTVTAQSLFRKISKTGEMSVETVL